MEANNPTRKPLPLKNFIEATTTEQSTGQEGQTFHRGHVMFTDGFYWLEQFIPEGFIYMEAWADEPYRAVWASKPEAEHNVFITYCEGDIEVSSHDTFEGWRDEHRRAARCYQPELAAMREAEEIPLEDLQAAGEFYDRLKKGE